VPNRGTSQLGIAGCAGAARDAAARDGRNVRRLLGVARFTETFQPNARALSLSGLAFLACVGLRISSDLTASPMRFDQEIVDAGNVQPVPVLAGNKATQALTRSPSPNTKSLTLMRP
jgi:hypothetical protein